MGRDGRLSITCWTSLWTLLLSARNTSTSSVLSFRIRVVTDSVQRRCVLITAHAVDRRSGCSIVTSWAKLLNLFLYGTSSERHWFILDIPILLVKRHCWWCLHHCSGRLRCLSYIADIPKLVTHALIMHNMEGISFDNASLKINHKHDIIAFRFAFTAFITAICPILLLKSNIKKICRNVDYSTSHSVRITKGST